MFFVAHLISVSLRDEDENNSVFCPAITIQCTSDECG